MNSSSDGRIHELTLQAAADLAAMADRPTDALMRADRDVLGIEPLFVRGVSDSI